jgi:hypothetical protein
MQSPSLPHPDDRGNRWLQTQVLHILSENAVALTAARTEGDPACYWGTGLETETTLYLCVAGDPEPKALRFQRNMIMGCGSGLYPTQHNAVLFVRRMLKKMGILSA